jgi:hypothetical protein
MLLVTILANFDVDSTCRCMKYLYRVFSLSAVLHECETCLHAVRTDLAMRVLENRMLEAVFGPNMTKQWLLKDYVILKRQGFYLTI